MKVSRQVGVVLFASVTLGLAIVAVVVSIPRWRTYVEIETAIDYGKFEAHGVVAGSDGLQARVRITNSANAPFGAYLVDEEDYRAFEAYRDGDTPMPAQPKHLLRCDRTTSFSEEVDLPEPGMYFVVVIVRKSDDAGGETPTFSIYVDVYR